MFKLPFRSTSFDHALVASMFLNRTPAALPPEVEICDSEIFDAEEWSKSMIMKLEDYYNNKQLPGK